MPARSRRATRAAVQEHLDDLYDFALTVTWDPERAVDAVLAALVLLQTPEPTRAQLFAAVLRESLTRAQPPDPVRIDPAAEPPPLSPDQAELETIALSALSALDSGDRATLDLALRKTLGPDELAVALAIPDDEVDAAVNESRARADHWLGHYVLARIGTRDCVNLARVVDAAPPGLGSLTHDIEAHITECEICGPRREAIPPATSFFPLIPERPAPPRLQEAVKDSKGVLRRLTGEEEERPRRRWPIVVGVIVLLAVVAGAITVGALVVTNRSSSTATTSPTGALTASTQLVDLGTAASTTALRLHNPTGSAQAWRAQVDVSWLKADPPSGTLHAHASGRVTLTIDRTAAPAGHVLTTVRFVTGRLATPVHVQADVVHPPTVTASASAGSFEKAPCNGANPSITISATAIAESGVATVVLDWTQPDGQTGEAPMPSNGSGGYASAFGPFGFTGAVTWSVSATDANGLKGSSAPQSVQLTDCATTTTAGRRR